MNWELPDAQDGYTKGRGTRDQIASICWMIEKAREFQKICASLTTLKPLTVWITTNCGKFLEMGIPDYLTCLLRNMYAGQEATVRTGHRTLTGSKLGKEYVKTVYCYPACLTYMLHTYVNIYTAWLEESQAGIKIARRNINNLRYADDTIVMPESEEELKSNV